MTRLLCMALILLSWRALGQAPQLIPYQAIARDASGNALSNQNIGLRFSIHDQAISGTIVWQEAQTALSGPLGVIATSLGSVSDLSSVNWANGGKFLQVEMDVTGGTNYTDIGTQQMMSVPYALHAGSSSNISSTNGNGLFKHWIGELFGGGIICHLWKDQNGVEHGLIASLVDLGYDEDTPPFGVQWQNDNQQGPISFINEGAPIANPYDGELNTIFLIGQNNLSPTNPATLCANFQNEGFNNWYLPAPLELEIIWSNIYILNSTLQNIEGAQIIGCSQWSAQTNEEVLYSGSVKNIYWSSTLYANGNAFYYRKMAYNTGSDLIDTNSNSATLNYPFNVRAIRKF
jgi:hypothetical protein